MDVKSMSQVEDINQGSNLPTSKPSQRERAVQFKDRFVEAYQKHAEENRSKHVGEAPNPFVYEGPLWTQRQIGLVLAGIIIIPIRFVIFCISALTVWVLLKISVSGDFDPEQPMRGWRRWVQYPVAFIVRFVMFAFGFYWVETEGEPCDPKDARIIVAAPHSTIFDTLYLVYAYRVPSCISKAENKKLPLAGTLFQAMQAIAVDRANREEKDQAVERLTKFASDTTQNRHLLIFPEGTCTNRKALITFKRGAFVAGEPVQPVCLEWPWTGFDLTWTAGGPSRLGLAFHAAVQPILKLKVTFMPVYYPNEEEKKDPILFARNVRALMAKKLGVPCTNHSYEDMFLAKEARKLHVPVDKVSFELNEISTLFSISLADAKALMKRYASIYKNSERVDGPGFAKILGIPYSRPVRELYELLRQQENAGLGEAEGIDFKQLLIGIASLSKAISASDMDESIQLIWDAVADGKDLVTEPQVYERLSRVFGGFTRAHSKKMFSSVDAQRKGKIDFTAFREFIRSQPELIFVSLGTIAQREKGRRLSVLLKDGRSKKASSKDDTKDSGANPAEDTPLKEQQVLAAVPEPDVATTDIAPATSPEPQAPETAVN